MKRKSFLRNIPLEQVIIQEWHMPSIPSQPIGFGICPESGLVMQSPSPRPDDIKKYYSETATYINPGREGKPSEFKVMGLNRLINIVIDTIGQIPDNIFQVGCSDGYTLHRFKKAGAKKVCGIDPSKASHKLAKKLYGIETIVGTIEDYKNIFDKFNLVILTHVLEHLFNPIKVLNKCHGFQEQGGWVLVEVPLFERVDLFPPGMLALEHLNYFSESTLLETITTAGYDPKFIGKYFNIENYPVITVIATKSINYSIIKSEDCSGAKKLLMKYVNQEKRNWKNTQQKIKNMVAKGSIVYIYGAGIHTSQLLAFTDLKENLNILGLLDSSPTKWGKKLGDLKCHNPQTIHFNKGDIIIISSFASENEIYESLVQSRQDGIKVIRLYD